MTDRFVGLGGNDGNSGLTWALRKLTLNGVEDTPVVAGDDVHVGPGVYRELLTVDVSGGNTYVVGTVNVVNGSTTVTGVGTAFLANVAAGYILHIRRFASAADGVTNGTATFTSAGGNFQANMIGKVIQINTKGAYAIGAVAAANSITLTDPNGLGWPAAGAGLTYSVMSGEGSYEIASVTDNTHFELVKDWCGPTLTGLTYITYNPIRYIADVTGEMTDGVGGIVRITGSDNDQTITRANCIDGNYLNYRLFRGFYLDTVSQAFVRATGAHITIEDCPMFHSSAEGILASLAFDLTIRRCTIHYVKTNTISRFAAAPVDDTGFVIEDCVLVSAMGTGLLSIRGGGMTLRNCSLLACVTGIQVSNALTVGQTIDVRNSVLAGCFFAMKATVVGEITEDHNGFDVSDSVLRTNVATGANSKAWTALLLPPILEEGFKFPWWFGELSEWSPVRAIAGSFESCNDLRGFVRPVTSSKKSWGATQFQDVERETGTVRTGSVSMAIRDAGRHQIWVPVEASSTTIKVYVYREANYAGLLPQMIIKQPGVADRVTTDVGAAGGWNLLTDTFVPAAIPPYVVVELVSRNTNGAADEVFFDDLDVS